MSNTETGAETGEPAGFELDRIVLPVRAGVEPSGRPPVRIFLGTESAQYRADRVLVWSIEKVRDPSRVYEITLLKDLPGFDRRGWTTSFTNYRFAIPHLMGGEGRAIYNDEDQVYLSDPGELFDLEMGDHGYRAVSPQDTSVMLLDAARMKEVWPLEASQKATKRSLLRRASGVAGLYGALDGAWNVRDESLEEGAPRCLHYTTLHTQPWRPFPERFVYDSHPDEETWFELEREASAAGFRLFRQDAPSRAFVSGVGCETPGTGAEGDADAKSDESIQRLVAAFGAEDLLDVRPKGSGHEEGNKPRWGASGYRACALRACLDEVGLERDVAGVVCLDGLSAVPRADVPWVVDRLFDRARDFVFARVRCEVSVPVAGRRGPPPGTDGGSPWWKFVFESAAARRPGVHWELELLDDPRFPESPSSTLRGGAFPGAGAPRVWVLEGGGSSHDESSRALIEELGWPFEVKRVEPGDATSEFEPPWPDLVIASGPGLAEASKRVRRSAGGRTLNVQLGEGGSDPAADFDLSVVSLSARRFPHPQRLELVGPVVPATDAKRRPRVPGAEPRVALLSGGGSEHRVWDRALARKLGADVAHFVREAGGRLVAGSVSALDSRVEAELRRGLGEIEEFAPGKVDGDIQQRWFETADVFIVTGDDDRLLARACATGQPVLIYPVPRKPAGLRQFALDRFREGVYRGSRSTPLNRRGTTRPQKRNELRCARWIERGWVAPVPEPCLFHERLVENGQARFFRDGLGAVSAPLCEVRRVAERVRAMLGAPDPRG
ncbi:MAG: ELM1/GtrOC1 family putative glycosyltransferase [Myxococcota bacterium]|nr:ELM1/GtrOC1 family putative glycosyltransferase [Myxococcota bacterium]